MVVAQLPAYEPLAAKIVASARRTVRYQSGVNLATDQDHPELMRWAAQATPYRSLRWWETWAACGSSLDTLALLAAAADPAMDPARAAAIEGLYWPWAGALHTLLDGLTDRAEDAATSQPNLLDLYASPHETAERMAFLTAESVRRAAAGADHSLILAGMVSLYLSDREAWVPASRPAAESILDALGELAAPAMLVLRARRFVRRSA